MVRILEERTRVARAKHLLYCGLRRGAEAPTHVEGEDLAGPSPDYQVHQAGGETALRDEIPSLLRSFRFVWGHDMWNGIGWYFSQLTWPEPDHTRGVTWLELVMDFERTTGLRLPGAARFRERRSTGNVVRFRWAAGPSTLAHQLVSEGGRVKCSACGRSAADNRRDRASLMAHSCAGIPETTAEAVRRHRLEAELRKQGDWRVPSVGERGQLFADVARHFARRVPCFPGECVLACRALLPLGLPLSAGLARRPVLLQQEAVSAELLRAAALVATDGWLHDPRAQWHDQWTPAYESDWPAPLWPVAPRPPPAPD